MITDIVDEQQRLDDEISARQKIAAVTNSLMAFNSICKQLPPNGLGLVRFGENSTAHCVRELVIELLGFHSEEHQLQYAAEINELTDFLLKHLSIVNLCRE